MSLETAGPGGFTTQEEAAATAVWWQLSWEGGNNGKRMDPPTPPVEPGSVSESTALAAVNVPPGEFPCV